MQSKCEKIVGSKRCLFLGRLTNYSKISSTCFWFLARRLCSVCTQWAAIQSSVLSKPFSSSTVLLFQTILFMRFHYFSFLPRCSRRHRCLHFVVLTRWMCWQEIVLFPILENHLAHGFSPIDGLRIPFDTDFCLSVLSVHSMVSIFVCLFLLC